MKLHEVKTVKILNVEPSRRTVSIESASGGPNIDGAALYLFRARKPPNPPEADKFRMKVSLDQHKHRVLLSIF